MPLDVDSVIELLRLRGSSQYGGEAVTQREHALQAAMFAERSGADVELVAAALLHDVGHLLHHLPDDAPDSGVDDRHEMLAGERLADCFGPAVVEPIRMHVAAKRYLYAADPAYRGTLSEPSLLSLRLQGGPMNAEEMSQFEKLPHFDAAVRLRRWDEAAKIEGLETPDLDHFVPLVRAAAERRGDEK
jgi:phosphonate degradation associated HDIG domain protein